MPLVRFPLDLEACPVPSGPGVLGKKWTLPILRDVYTLGEARFSDIRPRNEGLSDRVLSLRLRELSREGLLERRVGSGSRPGVTYVLTGTGGAAIRVVGAFVEYGVHALAAQVHGSRDPPGSARPPPF